MLGKRRHRSETDPYAIEWHAMRGEHITLHELKGAKHQLAELLADVPVRVLLHGAHRFFCHRTWEPLEMLRKAPA